MALAAPHRQFSIFRYRLKIIAVAGGSLGVPLLVVVLYLFTDLFFTPPAHVASQPESGDWAMFGRDLAHTGAADVPGPEPRGSIKWTFATGAPIHSSPAVAGGIVYFGSQDSILYALDSTTGRLVWQFRAGSLIRTSPAVVDGVLYFGAHDGSIRALNAATGEQLWSYREKYAITSSPAVADGGVYVGTTAKRLLALDAATGKRTWSAPLVGQVHSSPAVANGLIYVGTLGEFFYTVHARDGRIRTWFRTRRDVTSSPAVDGTSVYFTTTAGRLHAIDGTRRGLPLEHRIRPLLLRMRAIGLPVPRLGAQTGHLWARDIGTYSVSSPLLAGDALYVGADDSLVAIDLGTREVRWRFRTHGPVSSSPRLAGDLVLVGSEDGHVYAMSAATGELHWKIRTAGKVTSSPAVAGGTVFVGSHDGTLYAIE